MRKMYLEVKIKVIVTADDDVTIDDIKENLHITPTSDSFGIEDYEVEEIEVTDSK